MHGAGDGTLDAAAVCDEWLSLREYIRQNHHHATVSQKFRIQSLLTHDTLGLWYPNMSKLTAVLLIIRTNIADCERAFSTLKRIRTRLQSQLKKMTPNALMIIRMEGTSIDSFNFEEAVMKWASL